MPRSHPPAQPTTSGPSGVLDLPDGVLERLARHLDLEALLALRGTCQQLKELAPMHVDLNTIRHAGRTLDERLVGLSRSGQLHALRFLRLGNRLVDVQASCALAAAAHGQLDVLELLDGQALYIMDPSTGCTPLHVACRNGHTACVRKLILGVGRFDFGVDRHRYGNTTPLMEACGHGHAQCALVLLGAGADVHQRNFEGLTPLMISADSGHEACIRALTANKACVHDTDDDGWTALMFAAQSGHEGCITALLAAGAAWHIVNSDGSDALILACRQGHEGCIRALQTAGARSNVLNEDGDSALMIACRDGEAGCVTALLEAPVDGIVYPDMTPLLIACKHGHADCVRLLMAARFDPDVSDEEGNTAWMHAAMSERKVDVLRALICGVEL